MDPLRRQRDHALPAPTLTARATRATALTLALVVSGGCVAGCGGGSSGRPSSRTPPDLAAFLRLPVATPTACPPGVSASTVGRRSPWVGHVDVSVFLLRDAPPRVVRSVGAALRRLDGVQTVYVESRAEAYAEFQRLYTCSAGVPRSQVPASYRLVLHRLDRTQRDAVVRRILRLSGVDTVSCDPADPCVDVVRSPSPASPTSR